MHGGVSWHLHPVPKRFVAQKENPAPLSPVCFSSVPDTAHGWNPVPRGLWCLSSLSGHVPQVRPRPSLCQDFAPPQGQTVCAVWTHHSRLIRGQVRDAEASPLATVTGAAVDRVSPGSTPAGGRGARSHSDATHDSGSGATCVWRWPGRCAPHWQCGVSASPSSPMLFCFCFCPVFAAVRSSVARAAVPKASPRGRRRPRSPPCFAARFLFRLGIMVKCA